MANIDDFDNSFETYDDFEKRMRTEGYFGYFSSGVRKKLLAKNIPTVSNVYDVLYAETRESLLAKNTPLIGDSIEKNYDLIRIDNLKRNVENVINIDLVADKARQQNESRNSLTTSVSSLETIGNAKREELLSKNNLSFSAPDATIILKDQLASNKPIDVNIDTYAKSELRDELSANNPIGVNIDTYASNELIDEQSANVPIGINIDTYAGAELTDEQSANIAISINIDTYASNELTDEQSANIPIGVNIDTYASNELADEQSANVPIGINIDTYASNELIDEQSANVPIGINIDTYAGAELIDEQSSNIPITVNIDTYAGAELIDEQSANAPITVNIDTYASNELADEQSSNIPIGVNIDTYASNELADEQSANVPIGINIDTYAGAELVDEQSANVPIGINIDTYAGAELTDELSTNVPIGINIDTYAGAELVDELSTNVPIGINIDTYAGAELVDELSTNVPITINIDTYASAELGDELAANVPIGVSIDTYAVPEWLDEMSTNVSVDSSAFLSAIAQAERYDNLLANVPIGINIDTYAGAELIDELSTNVPIGINIDTYSAPELEHELSSNVPNTHFKNIDTFFDAYGNLTSADFVRDSMFSKNDPNTTLGTTVLIGGTSMFLGISDLLIQGAVVSNIMTIQNKYALLGRQYTPPAGVKATSNQAFTFTDLGVAAKEYRTQFLPLMNNREREIELSLLGYYGIGTKGGDEIIYTIQDKIEGQQYIQGQKTNAYDGKLTKAIRDYNLARNYYSLNGGIDMVAAQQKLESVLNEISNSAKPTEGSTVEQGMTFFDSYTNAGLKRGAQNKPLEKTNTNSIEVDAIRLLKSSTKLQPVSGNSAGSAQSMMSQIETSDVISNTFLEGETPPTVDGFGTTKRGVRNIINVISQSKTIPLAQNYVRGNNEFIVGQNRKSYQRYTYIDPYVVDTSSAKQLNFSLTNYASDTKMYFPPYIKSYRHDATANWVTHEFLGRPEPVYTYNNGNRSGSISLIVLTDYAESVQYGSANSNGDVPDPKVIKYNFSKNTQKINAAEIASLKKAIADDDKQILDKQKQIDALNANSNANNSTDIAALNTEISALIKNKSDLQEQIKNFALNSKIGDNYNEFVGAANYAKSIDASQTSPWSSVDTKSYLDEVIGNLMFVPAYFSGSKADFLTKMDFLQKLTRPAKSNGTTGFAFTKPPVCHVVLGDWFDWDIVVENVSVDYSESIWTLDENFEGRVQPMYATVDISFKIVGSYGGGGTPPLADDVQGIFYKKG